MKCMSYEYYMKDPFAIVTKLYKYAFFSVNEQKSIVILYIFSILYQIESACVADNIIGSICG